MFTWYRWTSCKRISCKTSGATTYRIVINNLTFGSNTTCAWTWVSTLELVTCSILWAFIIYYTFWSTVGRRTCVFWLAATHSLIIILATHTVWSTRRWTAWICYCCFSSLKKDKFIITSWIYYRYVFMRLNNFLLKANMFFDIYYNYN